ncbi:hypothetical protein [Nocardiopsis alba]|uniref:hypothetical protein n=1 Tax=Nocardiopsis alba TaxID=53437 RepID=UPI0033BDD329
MIKADPGYVATYAATGSRKRGFSKEIAAWDDDGHPMVVNHKGLVRAESISGYESVIHDGSPLPFAFIPGNGWMVEHEDGKREPLVAWAVCTYGGGDSMFVLPMFTEEYEAWRSGGGTWTGAKMGGDPDPVRVVPEKPGDRA